MKKFLTYIFLLSIISVIGCSQDSGEVAEIKIIIKDHKFHPNVSEIPANQKIVLIVENQDDTIEEFESVDLKREKIIPANSSARIIIAPLKPGKYNFFGEFHEDTAQGSLIAR